MAFLDKEVTRFNDSILVERERDRARERERKLCQRIGVISCIALVCFLIWFLDHL